MDRVTPDAVWSLLRRTVEDWMADGAPSMGAALAFFTMFSMAPLLVLVIAVAGLVVGAEAARGLLFDQLVGLVGRNGAEAIQAVLAASSDTKGGVIATAVSVVLLGLGATTVFAELRADLDRIWKYQAPRQRGLWKLLRARLLSFGMVLAIGFLLLVSLVVNAAVAAIGSSLSGAEAPLQIANFAGSVLVETLLFAMIYKILPTPRIAWRDVWIGAAATALLFELGKFLIGLYLGKSAISSAFGAAGTLVVVIVWVYYSAQVFFLGAEFTHAYSERRRPGEGRDSLIGPRPTPG